MPVSVLEAMNAGLLVISSRVGGLPYMINDGESGLLFESDNHTQLAEKMIWATCNPTMAKSIIKNARQEVKKYSWESVKGPIYITYDITA